MASNPMMRVDKEFARKLRLMSKRSGMPRTTITKLIGKDLTLNMKMQKKRRKR